MKYCWILFIGLLAGCATNSVELKALTPQIEWGGQAQQAETEYRKALDLLARGRQMDAEDTTYAAIGNFPDSQRLQFLAGVLLRSRFDAKRAVGCFAQTKNIEAQTVFGRASSIAVSLDLGLVSETGFRALEDLIDAYPDEILIRWLYAMEATWHKQHSNEAARQFEIILKEWSVAPIMVHQSYALLLTMELDEPERALEHRMLAAELEPNVDTYQGLANTLKKMKRYDQANDVYIKLLEMQPENPILWIQWGTCLFYKGDYAAATEKFQKVYALCPEEISSLLFQGRCLEMQNRPADAFALYEQALKQIPNHPQPAAYIAHAKLYGYGTAPDIEGALQVCREPGTTNIESLRHLVQLADRSDNPLAPEKSSVLLKHLTALGAGGNPDAGYNLGMILRYGIGVQANEQKAVQWFKQAAEHGHEISERMLNPPE